MYAETVVVTLQMWFPVSKGGTLFLAGQGLVQKGKDFEEVEVLVFKENSYYGEASLKDGRGKGIRSNQRWSEQSQQGVSQISVTPIRHIGSPAPFCAVKPVLSSELTQPPAGEQTDPNTSICTQREVLP